MSMEPRTARRWDFAVAHGNVTAIAWLLAALSISLILSAWFLPIVPDDALISYRYSDRLLSGAGLTWNDGEFVEGYSNLLWVLLVAAGGLIESDLIIVGWALGLAANAATLAAVAWTFKRSSTSSNLPIVVGLAVVALSSAFAFWGIGGLETALFSALLSWALATTYRPLPGMRGTAVPAVLLGLLSITRPDGFLFAATLGSALFWRDGCDRPAARRHLPLVIVPLTFVAAQTLFRIFYYGDLVPNTAYAKVAFGIARLSIGATYIGRGMLVFAAPLAAIVGVALLLGRWGRTFALRQAAVFFVPAAAWLAYVAVIGGDWFPFQRHWIPVLICLAFTLGALLEPLPSIAPRVSVPLLTSGLVLYVATQVIVDPWMLIWGREHEVEAMMPEIRKVDKDGAIERAMREFPTAHRAEWRYKFRVCMELGNFLRAAFEKTQPLIAVNLAGCVPYVSKLPSLDMLGLTDSYLAHHRPSDMGSGAIGHELGDGAYILSRRPDLIMSCSFGTIPDVVLPCFRSLRDMFNDPQFHEKYRLVFFRANDAELPLWVRMEEGRVGIVRTTNTIRIPGFLLASTPGSRAVLSEHGELATVLETGEAVLADVYFPPGTWKLMLESDAPASLQLAIAPGAVTGLAKDMLLVESDGAPQSLRVFGGHGHIRAIVAERYPQRMLSTE